MVERTRLILQKGQKFWPNNEFQKTSCVTKEVETIYRRVEQSTVI